MIAAVTQSERLIADFRMKTAQSITNNSPIWSMNNVVMWLEPVLDESFDSSESINSHIISTWKDQAKFFPSKNNATQASTTNSPTYIADCINHLPCARFDGINSYMNFDGSKLIASSYTVIVVEQRANNSVNNYFIAGVNAAANANLILGYRFDSTITFSQYSNDLDATVDAYSPDTSLIHTFIYNSNSGKNYYRNGVAVTLVTGAAGANPLDGLQSYDSAIIGSFLPVANYYAGDIAEIIIFNKALTSAERHDVEAYLSKKWKIIIS